MSAGAMPRRVPAAVAALMGRLPMLPPSALAALGLSLAAWQSGDAGVLEVLDGKVLRIVVQDMGVIMSVRCRAGRFVPVRASAAPDAAIGACLADFLALARRAEDPDTLFFARRLTLEGDTEAALALRNLLDRIDLRTILARVTN